MLVLLWFACILFDGGEIHLSCDEIGCELKDLTLQIEPENPMVSDTVSCITEPEIPASHIEAYRWELEDGTPIAQVETISLTPSLFSKGDVLVCSITLKEPVYMESYYSVQATIINSPPEINTIGISPAVPVLEYDGLYCSYVVGDLDGDDLVADVLWEHNDEVFDDVEADDSIASMHLKAGDRWRCTLTITDGDSQIVESSDEYIVVQDLAWQLIPAQTMLIGSPSTENGRDIDETLREVSLRNSYFVMQTEFTENMYGALTGTLLESDCWDCPMTGLNWSEAAALANRLSEVMFKEKCYECDNQECELVGNPYACQGYRLPTEAEWEVAARARYETSFEFGDLIGNGVNCEDSELDSQVSIEAFAWFCGNSSVVQAVGQLMPNTYMLRDMHGNVWEWTSDSYAVWGSGDEIDPYVYSLNSRVVKGGSYLNYPTALRSASRDRRMVYDQEGNIGFRLVYTME